MLARAGKIGVAAVLFVAVTLRVEHPTRAIAWFDEMLTALHTTGHTMPAAARTLLALPNPISAAEIQRQWLIPSPDHTVLSDLVSATKAEPSAGPLYYLLVRLAYQIWHTPMAAGRAVSSAAAVLLLPCMFLLCCELFGSRYAGLIGMCLAGLSPQQLYFAFDSRFYSLWGAAICFASWALLRALRRDRGSSWAIYSIAVAILMNCHLVSIAVLLAHCAIAALVARRHRSLQLALRFGAAAALGMLAMVPWLVVLLSRLPQFLRMSSWLSVPTSAAETLANVSQYVFANLFSGYDWTARWIYPWLAFATGVLLILSVVHLWRSGSRLPFIFITSLLVAAPLFLGLQDAVAGGRRLSISRYYEPTFIAMLTAVTGFLSAERTGIRRALAALLLVALLLTGGRTCYKISETPVPIGKPDAQLWQVAQQIRASRDPLVISPALVTTPLVLNSMVPPKTRFLFLGNENDLPRIDAFLEMHDLFVLTAATSFEPRRNDFELMLGKLNERYLVTPVEEGLARVSPRL